MTIHSSHPFMPSPEQRNPLRRLRGHLPAPVTIWTSADGGRRDGWTISSMLVADGDPGEFVALVNEDADWWDLFRKTGKATVNVLGQGQGLVSDVFARMAPSVGGPFGTGVWADAEFGPRLAGSAAWAEVSLIEKDPAYAGWGLIVRARVEKIDFSAGVAALQHLAGHYS